MTALLGKVSKLGQGHQTYRETAGMQSLKSIITYTILRRRNPGLLVAAVPLDPG